MKRLIVIMALATFLSCNGGRHDVIVSQKDSVHTLDSTPPSPDKVDTIYNSERKDSVYNQR